MLNNQIEDREYYKILNIDSKASLEEIRKSYKKLALEFHPDRNQEPDAEDRFKDISKAYQVLREVVDNRRCERMLASFTQTCG